jgi:hypothetical protein
MSRWYFVLLLAGMALPALGQSPAPKEQNGQPNTLVLTIKTGGVRLSDDSQTISGNDWLFERRASNVAAIEVETRLRMNSEFRVGGEVSLSEYRGASAPARSLEDADHALPVKSKYYHAGSAGNLCGGVSWPGCDYYALHTAEGLGYQAGRLCNTEPAWVEYMGLRARLADDSTGKVNASSHGLFVGVSFFFGRGGRSQRDGDAKGTEVPRF